MDFPDCPFIEESQTPLAQLEANHHTSIHIDTPLEICPNPEFEEGFESALFSEDQLNLFPSQDVSTKWKQRVRDRSNRTDIHCKQILWKFRKHYTLVLKDSTNYVMKKAKKGKSFYTTCLKHTLQGMGHERPTPRQIFFLGALIYPVDTRNVLCYLKPKEMKKEEALRLV